MRFVVQSDAFIQLKTTHKIKLSFIAETEKGAKGKIAERQTEREGERAENACTRPHKHTRTRNNPPKHIPFIHNTHNTRTGNIGAGFG